MTFIPRDLIPDTMTQAQYTEFISECSVLWKALVAEYFGEEYASRKHGSHKTNIDGCTGPACMAAARAYRRGTRGSEPNEHWARFDPILASFIRQVEHEIAQAKAAMQRETRLKLDQMRPYHIGEVHIFSPDSSSVCGDTA